MATIKDWIESKSTNRQVLIYTNFGFIKAYTKKKADNSGKEYTTHWVNAKHDYE
ncbi:MAG: hypothetical protein ACOWWH_00345 [Eubacteriaceae bacterium]